MKEQLSRLRKGIFVYGIGHALNRLIGFLLLPLFTAYLTPTDYGIISILGFIVLFITPIFGLGFGVSSGIVYFEGRDDARKSTTIWTAFILLVFSSIVLLAIGITFSKEISYLAFQTDVYDLFVKLTLSGICLDLIVQPFMLRLQFEEQSKQYITLTTISTLVTIAFNLLFVIVLERGVQGWIEGGLIGRFVSLVLFIVMVAPTIKFSMRLSVGRKLLKLGCPMIPAFFFLFIMQHSGRYMLKWYGGLEAVGVYTIGYNFGMIMNLAVSSFTTAWYPYFNSFVNKQQEVGLLFGKILTYYTYVFGALNLLLFIFARPLVILMTQPSFYESYKVIGMVALAQFFIGIFSILLPGIYFAKEVYLTNLVQFSSSIIVVVLNFNLIPIWGIQGAALSLLVGFIVMVVLQYILNYTKDYLRVEYEWIRIVKFTCLFIVTVAALNFFGSMLFDQVYIVMLVTMVSIVMLVTWSLLLKQERLFLLTLFLKQVRN